MTTHFRYLSDKDHQKIIDSRIQVSSEIYSSIVDKCKSLLDANFPSDTKVIHEADKSKILALATLFFEKIVSHEDIVAMAKDVSQPDIIEIEIENGPEEVLGGIKSKEDELGDF